MFVSDKQRWNQQPTFLLHLTMSISFICLDQVFHSVSVWYCDIYGHPGVDNSAGPLARWPDACFEGVGPVRATSFHILLARRATALVSTMELFTIVLDSFHQLSLLTQQLNIICDSVDSRYQSKLVTILFTNCKFSITSPGVATGDVRRRRDAETRGRHLPSELAKITLRIL